MKNTDVKENKKSFIKNLGYCIWTLYSSISFICIAALAVINSTWIYKFVINKYNLDKLTGLSSKVLMSEYRGLIDYLQNPFIKKLEFENFIMSTNGEVHFYEVKKIFIVLMIITAVFSMAVVVWVIFKRGKDKKNIKGLLKSFNVSADILIAFFISIVVLYFIDFSWAFTMFHKIFFRNDYWIFDPKLDPIITVLPEELFMICGGAILALILVMIIAIKVYYYRKIRKSEK